VPRFIAPLGVGAHLERWGIAAEKIQECDWWESVELAGLQLHCTPARHFSARGLFDRHATLWCSWALRTPGQNILLGADSGYGPHFKMMGERLGPFDLALLECGQYNDMWKQIHSMPEEIPLAWRDLKAERIMPIHWGAFKLAMHDWTEPVDRLLASVAREEQQKIVTPLIGQRFNTKQLEGLTDRWWEEI
jgi:L-ascorbate metabolism protein UlaG (beta-lactamase superfamily)